MSVPGKPKKYQEDVPLHMGRIFNLPRRLGGADHVLPHCADYEALYPPEGFDPPIVWAWAKTTCTGCLERRDWSDEEFWDDVQHYWGIGERVREL